MPTQPVGLTQLMLAWAFVAGLARLCRAKTPHNTLPAFASRGEGVSRKGDLSPLRLSHDRLDHRQTAIGTAECDLDLACVLVQVHVEGLAVGLELLHDPVQGLRLEDHPEPLRLGG